MDRMRAPMILLLAFFVPVAARSADLCLVKAAGSRLDLFQAQQKFEGNGLAVRPCESLENASDCDLIVVFNGFPSQKSAAQWEDETNAAYRAQYRAHGGAVSSIELAKNVAIYEFEADVFDGPTKIQLKHADLQPDFNFFPNLKYAVTGDALKPQREAAAKMAARRATEEAERRQPAPPSSAQDRRAKAVVSDVDRPAYRDAARPDDVALVVGVEKYNDLPDATFAERDATTVRDHLLALGFAPRHVILLTGSRATRSEIALNVERRLPKLVKPTSAVFFCYSGHGAPDPATGKAYLLPADGDPEYLEDSAYPVARLKERLGALKAKSVLVALDSCFSGAGGRSVLAKGTRPLVTRVNEGDTPARVTVLTASGANEVAGSLDEQGHGAFTYYFLKGLASGRRSFKQLYEFVKPGVEDAARLSNRSQSPVLSGPDAAL